MGSGVITVVVGRGRARRGLKAFQKT